MTRPRRDPRAERDARRVEGGARPRLALRPAGRPRRDPRAEAAAAVVQAARLRLDRTLRGAVGAALPVAVAARSSDPPPVSVIAHPAFFVLAVADGAAGQLSAHDRQLLGAARLLADAADAGGAVLLLAPALTAPAGPAGADLVALLAESADPEARAAAILDVIAARHPRHVLFPESETGGDSARRVAAALGEPLFAEAGQVGARMVVRRAGAGRVEQRALPSRLLSLAVDAVAPHAGPPRAGALLPPVPEATAGAASPRLWAGPRRLADPATVRLAEADFVVAAGNGVTDFAGFVALAQALHATPAGSRVVCDAGHLPRERQVGASGSVLEATCYLALGIAGAPQHLQGITRVQHVVAVNTDLHAAMVARAGLSVIADAQQVMPALCAALAAGDAAAPPAAAEQAAMVLPFPGTATVLLSAGRHPVSGRAAAVAVEAQATRLARMLGATVSGLHAGAEDAALREHLGMGLDRIDVPKVAAEADPLPVLASWLRAEAPALILAGRRGLGGADAGLLPYRLAQALGLPLVADVAALRLLPSGDLLATQALPRGARRDVRVRLPAVVTVHPAAPAPWPFAYARARRGRCVPLPSPGVGLPGGLPSLALEERPYRPRPRLLQAGPEQSGTVRGRVLINPAPAEAAREILAHLRAIGVLRPDS